VAIAATYAAGSVGAGGPFPGTAGISDSERVACLRPLSLGPATSQSPGTNVARNPMVASGPRFHAGAANRTSIEVSIKPRAVHHGPFRINAAGFCIAGLFVVVWAAALAYRRWGDVEARWTTGVPPPSAR
jgi:hypothetical protein